MSRENPNPDPLDIAGEVYAYILEDKYNRVLENQKRLKNMYEEVEKKRDKMIWQNDVTFDILKVLLQSQLISEKINFDREIEKTPPYLPRELIGADNHDDESQ